MQQQNATRKCPKVTSDIGNPFLAAIWNEEDILNKTFPLKLKPADKTTAYGKLCVKFPRVEILWKSSFRRVSGDFSETLRKLCPSTKLYTRKVGEITVFYAVKETRQ